MDVTLNLTNDQRVALIFAVDRLKGGSTTLVQPNSILASLLTDLERATTDTILKEIHS